MTDSNAMVVPVLRYRDAHQALRWLHEVFGFEQVMAVPGEDGRIMHAEMRFGAGTIMFGSGPGDVGTAVPDLMSAPFIVYVGGVPDVDAHCERARKGGAEITMEPVDQDYGSREYAARDLEGNHWSFGTYVPAAETS